MPATAAAERPIKPKPTRAKPNVLHELGYSFYELKPLHAKKGSAYYLQVPEGTPAKMLRFPDPE